MGQWKKREEVVVAGEQAPACSGPCQLPLSPLARSQKGQAAEPVETLLKSSIPGRARPTRARVRSVELDRQLPRPSTPAPPPPRRLPVEPPLAWPLAASSSSRSSSPASPLRPSPSSLRRSPAAPSAAPCPAWPRLPPSRPSSTCRACPTCPARHLTRWSWTHSGPSRPPSPSLSVCARAAHAKLTSARSRLRAPARDSGSPSLPRSRPSLARRSPRSLSVSTRPVRSHPAMLLCRWAPLGAAGS